MEFLISSDDVPLSEHFANLTSGTALAQIARSDSADVINSSDFRTSYPEANPDDESLPRTPSLGEGKHSPDVHKKQIKRARRAQACDRCRHRKVKCDALTGHPCSRCRRDRFECIVRPHERG